MMGNSEAAAAVAAGRVPLKIRQRRAVYRRVHLYVRSNAGGGKRPDTLERIEILNFIMYLIYLSTLLFYCYLGLAFYYYVYAVYKGFVIAIKGAALFLLLGYITLLFIIKVVEIRATLIALLIPGIRPLVENIYYKIIIRMSYWFLKLFNKRTYSLDIHSNQWNGTPLWQLDATPTQEDFIAKDIESVVEIAGIKRNKLPSLDAVYELRLEAKEPGKDK
ncbi:hypothetical protein CCHL11_07530 [Colletotrichum chlorophyti]|uniref:Uncharacterized protein n=1 Tax=Colletotrichum chlorophyti TaxID=708187 RepID=A0A1Q8S476_9PEZI|nr:hypothetical protein CCHL11_07530 [Colletotrichum chlorophyti]